jgi:hypothetical protein
VKTFLKIFAVLLLLLLLIAGGWAYKNRQNLRNLADLNAAWYAQHTCSCLFVTQLSDERCTEYVRQILPIGKMEIDRQKKTVRASTGALMLWTSATSRYQNERFGCALDKLK